MRGGGLGRTHALLLAKRGAKVVVNSLAPTAGTRMLEGLLPPEMLDLLAPEKVSPALLALVGEDAPNRAILCAGAGGVELSHITITPGIFVGTAEDAPEQILSRLSEIGDRAHARTLDNAMGQGEMEMDKARAALTLAEGKNNA